MSNFTPADNASVAKENHYFENYFLCSFFIGMIGLNAVNIKCE